MSSATTDTPKTTKKIRAKKPTEVIELPKIDIRRMQLTVDGDSSLISHRWSEKARKEMLDKQMKKGKQQKEAKDPPADYASSVYIINEQKGDRALIAAQYRDGGQVGVGIEDIRFGFPAVAFKAAAVGACRFADGVKMTHARGAFHVDGELIEIKGTPELREDMVRIGMGTADIRFRGEFKNWKATLNVRYNHAALSVEQIVNLFNTAGFGVGVGEWRPEKDGSYGMFHVSTGEGAVEKAA